MTKKYKDNIIPFPTKEDIQVKEDSKILDDLSNECVESSHFLLEVMEEFINSGQVSEGLMDLNFRDETVQESRDMFVIVNMLNAMFHRYYGIPHSLHREFDRLYAMIKLMDKQNSQARDELDGKYDILFTPDDGEDDDTT